MAWEKGPAQADSSVWQGLSKLGTNLVTYTPSARFISGGRVVIKINGIAAPRLSNIAWKITTDQKPIKEIDNFSPHELAPNSIDVSGIYTEYREPFRGSTAMRQQGCALSMMWTPYLSIEVRDNLTDALLFYTGKAAITERSESIPIDSLMITSIKWQALAWKDEVEPRIPSENAGKTTTNNTVTGGIIGGVAGIAQNLGIDTGKYVQLESSPGGGGSLLAKLTRFF